LGEYLSIEFASRPLAVLVLISFLAFSAAAQQTPQPSTADPSSQTSSKQAQDTPKAGSATQEQTKPEVPGTTSPQGKVAGTSNDRLFYTLPNFLTLQNAEKLPPLTTKEKFKVVALGTFDPIQYPWWGLLSAISQAEDSEPAYGQGWGAYGKRYLTTAADSTIENFMTGAVFPSVLHQDPRFYQSGKGSFARRTWYAASRILVTRGDSGNKQFNFSEVVGASLAAAISTYSYHPTSTYIRTPSNPHKFVGSDRTLSNTASVLETQISLDTITLVVKEFWPDVHRKLSKKHNTGVPQPAPSNP
jgi:hypothetical protein